VGEWKRGKYHGSGVMTWPDGRKYEGEWRNGKKEGQGTYTWYDEMGRQCKYEGEWKEDVKQGRGTLHFGNGTKHTGEWKANKAHGQGTKTWPRYATGSASPPASDSHAHLLAICAAGLATRAIGRMPKPAARACSSGALVTATKATTAMASPTARVRALHARR
jgi:hypothetical protein